MRSLKHIVCLGLSCLLLPYSAFAWNVTAHQVIAQIAYDQLTPQARKMVDQRYPLLGQFYPSNNSFVGMASWPDFIKGDDITAFDKWHYIDKPLSFEKMRMPKRTYAPNVVWAIHQSQHVLLSKKSNLFEQSIFLAFLTHFVGDVHQPLHAVAFYSSRFRHGDKGGNLFKVQSPLATNLHELWDNGLGLFPSTYYANPRAVRRLATQIEHAYPAASFGDAITVTNATTWANESYTIAKQQVYQIKPNAHLSKTYITEGQATVQHRVALAGYRLGYLLNTIYNKKAVMPAKAGMTTFIVG